MIYIIDHFQIFGGQESYFIDLASRLTGDAKPLPLVYLTTSSSYRRLLCYVSREKISSINFVTKRNIFFLLLYLLKISISSQNPAPKIITSKFSLAAITAFLLRILPIASCKIYFVSHLLLSDHIRKLGLIKSFTVSILDGVILQYTSRVCISRHIYNSYSLKSNSCVCIPNYIPSLKCVADQKAYDILFVGRLSPEKGISYLIPLLERLLILNPNIKFGIIGSGPDIHIVEYLTRAYPSNIFYEGFQIDPYEKYTAKLSLFPSEYEGLSLSFLESISQNILPLTSPIASFKAILNASFPFFTFDPHIDSLLINKIISNALYRKILLELLQASSLKSLQPDIWLSSWKSLLT